MKKKILMILGAMLAIGQNTFAYYDFSAVASSGQTLYYNITSGSTVTVTCPGSYYRNPYSGYTVPTGSLIIPSSVTRNGTTYSVTSIGDSAFYKCTGLTSVNIPNSVISIGDDAFSDCYGLTSVSIPNSVISIGDDAFYDCYGLTSVSIPNSVTSIGPFAFYYCHGLASIVVANGNTVYDSRNNCNAIIETATNQLIQGCKNTVIPSTVTSIGDYAFSYCYGLTSVSIPNSITSIGSCVFRGCHGLTSIVVASSNTIYDSRNNCNAIIETATNQLISGCKNTVIPSTVTSIGNDAFSGCIGLTSVTIPDDVTSIGDYAFFNCIGLTSVTIPDDVTSIGDYAFRVCTGLTSVTIGGGVASIGDYAFEDCRILDTVYMMPPIPPSLDYSAFDNNASGRVFMLSGCVYNDYYNSSSWVSYRDRFRDPVININVTVLTSNMDRGTASVILSPGNAIVRCDSTVVVQATANTDYHFDHWSTGSTANPATVSLTGDSTITAYFERNTYNLTVNANNASFGTVATPQGSSALYQDTLMAVATPANHYHVASWQGEGIVATSADKDTVWVRMLGNCTLTCNFVIDTHTVSVVSSDIIRGMVESSGTEFAYGAPCMVTATAYTGYTFAGWSNGVTANPYTFAVISDVELTALFVEEGEEVYTVTVESADPTMGSVIGGGQALNGGTVTISANPNDGYRFLTWSDGNTENPRTVTVTGNITYTAYFESIQGIGDIDGAEIKIYVAGGRIVVDGAEGNPVSLYDINGRLLATRRDDFFPLRFDAPASGAYMIKIGNHPARKVVVIR